MTVDREFFCRWSPSLLRAGPPAPSGDDPLVDLVDLVTGELDSWSLAADHDLDDPSAFRGASAGSGDRRWARSSLTGELSEMATRLATEILQLEPWCAPLATSDRIGSRAAAEAVLVEAAQLTPLGRTLGHRGILRGDWSSLRVVRVPPASNDELPWPGDSWTHAVALDRGCSGPPVVLRGKDGWVPLGSDVVARIPAGRIRVINRADRPAHVLVAEPIVGGPVSRAVRSLPLRYGRPRRRYRQAVELAAAVAS